jgi:hypothetical protein
MTERTVLNDTKKRAAKEDGWLSSIAASSRGKRPRIETLQATLTLNVLESFLLEEEICGKILNEDPSAVDLVGIKEVYNQLRCEVPVCTDPNDYEFFKVLMHATTGIMYSLNARIQEKGLPIDAVVNCSESKLIYSIQQRSTNAEFVLNTFVSMKDDSRRVSILLSNETIDGITVFLLFNTTDSLAFFVDKDDFDFVKANLVKLRNNIRVLAQFNLTSFLP